MDDSKNPPVEDAEIVPDKSTPLTETPNDPSQTFDINSYNATLEVVRRRLTILEKARVEMKKLKDMQNDYFANSEPYVEADKVVKDAMKKKKDVTAQLSKHPAAVELNGKLKDLKEQIKENEETLSQELMEYYKTAGVMEIETENGDVQEFTIVVKLKGKKKAEA